MCTVGRDQFPRSIKLTSSLLLLLLLMFNTAVTAMHPPPPPHHPPPHQDDLGRPPVCLAGGRAELVESQNATVHPPASPDYHTTKLHIAPSRKPIQKPPTSIARLPYNQIVRGLTHGQGLHKNTDIGMSEQ